MKTIELGKLFGIPIRIHWTFWLLPVYIFLTSFSSVGATMAAITVLLVFAIFGCVLLHELGHALAARQFGIPTRDIILLPIGGVASLERMPRNPWQELWIAVAGPLVNVVIAAVMFIGLTATATPFQGAIGVFLWQLMLANVILVLFNMIPAFPMDGGRVLRSVLAMFTGFESATEVAVTIGKIAAIGFGIFGLVSGNVMLAVVAGFIYLAGHSELAYIQQGRPVAGQDFSRERSAWIPAEEVQPQLDECVVPSTLTVESVVAWLNELRAETCRVVQSGRVIGRISKSQLIVALSNGFGRTPVGALFQN